MAIHQVPYTNTHELNLDWIMRKFKEFQEELAAIEDYDPRITAVENAIKSINTSLAHMRQSLTQLNARCTTLEDRLDDMSDSINHLYQSVAEDLTVIQAEVDNIRSQYNTLKAYIDINDRRVLDESKEFTLERIRYLLEWITEPELIYVVNPFTGEVQTIQQFINDLADYLKYAALTADEFDDLRLTAEDFDAMQIKALEYDMFGKYAIAFLHKAFVTITDLNEALENYATKEELDTKADKTLLDNYATLSQIKVINPVTGLLGTLQSVVDSLAEFHKNGITAEDFDSIELTATQFDNLMMSAFNYDFNARILLAQAGIITILTGLSAGDYDKLAKDKTGHVYVCDVQS